MEWLLLPCGTTCGVKWNGQPWWKCPEGYSEKEGNVACHTGAPLTITARYEVPESYIYEIWGTELRIWKRSVSNS